MGFEREKAIIALIGCQFLYAGTTVSVRAALLEDIVSPRVLVVYRQCVAFLLIAPIAFFPRRSGRNCRLEWKSFWWIFLLSFVGVTANRNASFDALALVSSSVASTMNNLVPVVTFIMAYIMGLEKVNLKNLRSVAKIIGTAVSVSGAVTLTLLKGPKLLNIGSQTESQQTGNDQTWVAGCLFAFVSASCWSLSLILQVNVTAYYKDHVSLTAWISLMGAVQSGILTLMIEPNMNAWKIMTSPFQLLCSLYGGMAYAVTFFIQAWCISRRGPLFSSLFQPLCTVIVTIFACIFMHEELYIGSLIGGLFAIIGLYVVLWGKAKDIEDPKEEKTTTISTQVSDKCIIDLDEPLLSKKVPN